MSGPATLPCFKAYDIRGRIPTELNRELVVTIARAYAAWLKPRSRRGRLRHPPRRAPSSRRRFARG